MPQATAYFARAGGVVKVSLGGMRMPSPPICPPGRCSELGSTLIAGERILIDPQK